jgi:thioester reductase-like protein
LLEQPNREDTSLEAIMTEPHPVILLTGVPHGFLAQQLLGQLLIKHPTALVKCLVAEPLLEQAQHVIRRLPVTDQARVETVRGDASAMDFGLSGPRFVALARQIDVIHHCVCANYAGIGRDAARRAYVGATGEALELALASNGRLQRLVHWGSALLAQPSNGRLTETEWRRPAAFRSRSDEMRFRAEVLIRDAMQRVPITILRPSIIIGDSKTGEIDPLEAPYALFQLMLNPQLELRVPVPGHGDQFCHFVPIDYVVEAGLAIADDPRSAGKTFHLTDERPLSVQRVFDLISGTAERPAAPPRLPRNLLAALLLHAPGMERVSLVPKAFLELLASDVAFDARNTRELLAGTGIACPSVTSYLKMVLARVQRDQESRSKPHRARPHPHFEEMEDPLDP